MERESGKIVDVAKTQAEDIRRKTEENLGAVYRKTFDQSIVEAKRGTAELVQKTKENVKREVNKILQTNQIQIEELQKKANKNFEKAVDFVVNEIVS